VNLSEVLDFLHLRKRAYRLCFSTPAGNEVLVDLSRFCRAVDTTWSEDARHHARLEGRREVWIRIQQHLRLKDEQLYMLYNGKNILAPDEEISNA
jgi:hypothetical protein